jgi:hypothetical protein
MNRDPSDKSVGLCLCVPRPPTPEVGPTRHSSPPAGNSDPQTMLYLYECLRLREPGRSHADQKTRSGRDRRRGCWSKTWGPAAVCRQGKAGRVSQEEMTRRLSKPAGPRASIPEKTAEAVGERVGDAYADPGSAAARNRPGIIARLAGTHVRRSGAVRQVLDEQPLMMVVASFALGYMTALVLHRRR